VCLGFGEHLSGAARDRLGGVYFVEDSSHRQALVDEFDNELSFCKAEFLDRIMVRFPVDHVKLDFGPSVCV
jgi:hypothetical protein